MSDPIDEIFDKECSWSVYIEVNGEGQRLCWLPDSAINKLLCYADKLYKESKESED